MVQVVLWFSISVLSADREQAGTQAFAAVELKLSRVELRFSNNLAYALYEVNLLFVAIIA